MNSKKQNVEKVVLDTQMSDEEFGNLKTWQEVTWKRDGMTYRVVDKCKLSSITGCNRNIKGVLLICKDNNDEVHYQTVSKGVFQKEFIIHTEDMDVRRLCQRKKNKSNTQIPRGC